MTDSTAAEGVNTFNGGFELRDWKEPRRIETPSGAIAWDLGGALEVSQNLLDEQESAGHVKETLEGEMRFFPANAKSAIVLEPGDGAFDPPASFAASQGSAVLGLRAIETVGCNHLDSLSGQQLVETVTVVSFITDDLAGVVCTIMKAKSCWMRWLSAGLAGVLQDATATPERQPG